MGSNTPAGLLCLILISLESCVGIFSTVFIIITISFSYFKHHNVSGIDKIIVALSVSNVCYACVAYIDIGLFYFQPLVLATMHIGPAVFLFIMFCLTTSSWLTASLCFFYYVKIENYKSSFFSWLKMKIGSLVPWMILVSVGLALFSSCLNILQFTSREKPSNSIATAHFSNASLTLSKVFEENLYISFISSLIPFVISVMTTASTAWSLNLHRLKMVRKKTASSTKGYMQRYRDAIRVMICLIIFYAVIYVAMFLFYFNIFATYSFGFWAFLIIMCSYSPTQSILLCLATTKLKKAWREIFHCRVESTGEEDSREE